MRSIITIRRVGDVVAFLVNFPPVERWNLKIRMLRNEARWKKYWDRDYNATPRQEMNEGDGDAPQYEYWGAKLTENDCSIW